MTRRWFVVAVLAVLLLLVVPVSADWLSGWGYRKSHVINNTGDALSDYQMMYTINRSSGTDSGSTVYVDTKCNESYDDIRFTKSDGTTLLDYWIEESDTDSATIWVEVDSIAASGDTTIYLYYGNPAAESTSNGDDTFPFFDDFSGSSLDTDKWEVRSNIAGSISVADSNLTITVPDSDNMNTGIRSIQDFDQNTQFIAKIDAHSNPVYGPLSKQDPPWYGDAASQFEIYGQYSIYDGFGIRINSNMYSIGDEPAFPYLLSVSWTDNSVRVQTSDGKDSGWKSKSGLTYPNKIAIFARDSSTTSGGSCALDFIFAREYSQNEPTHGAWGSEESSYEITADFSGVPTSGIVPLTVYFTDSSSSTGNATITIDAWSWDFGDDGVSSQQNPAHQYTTSGTYTVALTASNATYGTTDTETKTDYITVSIDTAAPTADFVATPLCEDIGDPIYFIDYSTGGGLYAWNWSFGDSSYSELRNPTHSYASNGTYDVALTVWGANGTDTLTKTGYITIPCGAPTPTPTVTPTPTGTTPTPTSSVTPGEVTESNVTYIYSDDQTFVPWALWLAVVGVMIAFFGHSLIFTRNTDLTATMACVLAFVAAGLSNMIGYIDIGVAAVGTDVAITPMIKAVHPPWLVYVMVMFALVSILNIVYQAWRIYLKPKDWSAIYRKRYERY
ncbi:MAG: DUF2341 domain-containing protein [Bacteroidales bacterium]|nr:DUF2341 domain-containing protein [Bacteroidales bacterium]